MLDASTNSVISPFGRLVTFLLNSRSTQAMAEVWKLCRSLASGLSEEGLYQVLEYDATLELLDKKGQRARFRKHQKVRYLQSQTIAFQDQAWGDGEILLNYRCAPGVPVDRYRPGQKTYILIALREVKRRGDVDEFNMEWGIRRGFVRSSELWETEVSHPTKTLKIRLIFPRDRPPLRVSILQGSNQRAQVLPDEAQVQLPDGRWLVAWQTDAPRRHERYILKWDW
jgi:hypothetical protein